MNDFTTYSVLVPVTVAVELCAALNRPTSPDDGGEPGVGMNTCRTDPSTYPGYSADGTEPAEFRGFSFPVRPENRPILLDVCGRFEGVSVKTIGHGADYQTTAEHYEAEGLAQITEGIE